MHLIDVIGLAASLLVLLTFCMRDMASLRTIALCSNFAFLTYGIAVHLSPIVLHGILIPISACRLGSLQDQTAAARADKKDRALKPSEQCPDFIERRWQDPPARSITRSGDDVPQSAVFV